MLLSLKFNPIGRKNPYICITKRAAALQINALLPD